MIGFDWHDSMTADQARIELEDSEGKPFNFKGPGWYMEGGDVLLVVQNPNDDKWFEFYCWNQPDFDPRDRLNEILTLPRQTT